LRTALPAPPSANAFDAIGMSELYGPADEAESAATIHAALDAGITVIDSGDFYLREEVRDRSAGAARDGEGRPAPRISGHCQPAAGIRPASWCDFGAWET
jgi:hypothetical protein